MIVSLIMNRKNHMMRGYVTFVRCKNCVALCLVLMTVPVASVRGRRHPQRVLLPGPLMMWLKMEVSTIGM